MTKNNNLKNRLNSIQKDKDAIKGNPGKVINNIISQEQETPDFAKIAEELQQRHEQEKRSLNDSYVKDTIYIEENIYKAFNALCTERGMKKQLVNEALADFVQKKYRELQQKNR